jgi:hypothetical protein
MEGVVFDPPVRVRVLNEAGQPIQGKSCYAVLASENGNDQVLLFRRHIKGQTKKELVGALSEPSDANGEAVFPELAFSAQGNTLEGVGSMRLNFNESFSMRFLCDGESSDQVTVNTLRSKVAEVRIQRFIHSEAFVSRYMHELARDNSDIFLAVVRVVDANGAGVQGKSVKIVATDEQGSPPTVELISGSTLPYLSPVEASQEPTSPAGFALVPFRVVTGGESIGASGVQQFRVFFNVDATLSAPSMLLTARVRGSVHSDVCHAVIIPLFATRPLGTTSWTPYSSLEQYDTFQVTPVLNSGQMGFVQMMFVGISKNISYTASRSRRLTAEEHRSEFEAQAVEFHRRLQQAEEDGTHRQLKRSRRLTSAGGSLTLELQQAYSTDGEELCSVEAGEQTCQLQVPHEPTLTMPSFLEIPGLVPEPTLADLQTGDPVNSGIMIQGPAGTHFVRVVAQINLPGAGVSRCYSPLLKVQIRNTIEEIEVVQGEFPQLSYDQNVDIVLRIHPSPGGPAVPSNLFLTEDVFAEGAVYFQWLEVPFNMIEQWGLTAGTDAGRLMTPYYNMTEFAPYTVGEGVGVMSIRINMLMQGTFGFFALMFGSKGVFSDYAYFEILEPPNIQYTIVQEPGFGPSETELRTQMVLPVQPMIRVTSNGQPIDGLIVFAQPVPADASAKYGKITATNGFDATGFSNSHPSSFTTDTGGLLRVDLGEAPVPSTNSMAGVAVYHFLMLPDGSGCFRFRFLIASRIHYGNPLQTEPVPNDPLCFRSAVRYSLGTMPPTTLPLAQRLDQITGTNATFVVNVEFPEGPTNMFANATTLPMLLYMRLTVANYGNANGSQWLSAREAGAKTRELLANAVCLFGQGSEFLSRCADMQFVQTSPYPIISVRVVQLTWARVTERPSRISIVPTDLALSEYAGMDNEIQMPQGMPQMSLRERTQICTNALRDAQQPLPISTSISPEELPVTALIELPPPNMVTVGAMFLVRVRLSTQSGGPVGDSMLRTAIVPTVATTPSTSGGSMLEQMGSMGNTLSAFAVPRVQLDPGGVLRRSGSNGVVSFPLSILEAKSGTYTLRFQSESPGAQVLLTSPPFTVVNPIDNVSAADEWGAIEVDEFNRNVTIPRQVRFRVTTRGQDSLQGLSDLGITLRITLTLKSLSPSVQQAMANVERARREATQLAENRARAELAQRNISGMAENAAAQGLQALQARAQRRGDPFMRLTPELREECMSTSLGALQRSMNATGVRPATVSEAVAGDPSAMDPSETLSQFVRTATGGGTDMATSASMKEQLQLTVSLDDLTLITSDTGDDGTFQGVYEVNTLVQYSFTEGYRYAWEVSVNGVGGDPFPDFAVTAPQPEPVERALNWVASTIAALLGVVVLATNTTKHHWAWFAVAITATIGVACWVPSMKESGKAMNNQWPVIAICNLVLILICLVWGILVDVRERKGKPAKLGISFATKRRMTFETYTRRRLVLAIAGSTMKSEPDPGRLPLKVQLKQMIKPFNDQTAFYFPSQLWAAFVLGLFAYVYALISFIGIIDSVKQGLDAMLNKTIEAGMRYMMQMDNVYLQATQQDLPDAATGYMMDQLGLLRTWFKSLTHAVTIGFYLGIAIAAVFTILGLLGSFVHFRWVILQMRMGIKPLPLKHGLVIKDCEFMGSFVASTIVGFAAIVLVVVLLVVVLSWKLMWELIISHWKFIVFTLIVPKIYSVVEGIVMKKLLFTSTSIKNRAAVSIYMFWQVWLSLLAGATSAIMRIVFGVVSLLVSLPQIVFPATAPLLNKLVMLDAPYSSYVGAIYMYHYHNHPIAVCAANRLMSLLANRKLALEEGGKSNGVRRLPLKKRLVILLLMVHPWLQEHRKAAIAARREAAKEKKKNKADVELQIKSEEAGKKQAPKKIDQEEVRLRNKIEQMEKQLKRMREGIPELRSMAGQEQKRDFVSKLLGTPEPNGAQERRMDASAAQDDVPLVQEAEAVA